MQDKPSLQEMQGAYALYGITEWVLADVVQLEDFIAISSGSNDMPEKDKIRQKTQRALCSQS